MLYLVLLLVCLTLAICHEGYDSSNVQFHPSGRILLTEYAKEVVKRGGPITAIKSDDGIVMVAARPKLQSSLQISGRDKVFFIDKHIAIAASGSLQSIPSVVRLARKISLQHRSIFDAPVPVEKLCDGLASAVHTTTISADARRPVPLGLVIAGFDDALGYQLYSIDPEGSVHGWNAVSIGKHSDEIMQSMVDIPNSNRLSTVWPQFRSRVSRILRSGSTSDTAPLESELNENQKEFRNEYIRHHSEEEAEWDLEGYICSKDSVGQSSPWLAISNIEWVKNECTA